MGEGAWSLNNPGEASIRIRYTSRGRYGGPMRKSAWAFPP